MLNVTSYLSNLACLGNVYGIILCSLNIHLQLFLVPETLSVLGRYQCTYRINLVFDYVFLDHLITKYYFLVLKRVCR